MVCVVVGVSAAGINAAKTLREIDKNIEIIHEWQRISRKNVFNEIKPHKNHYICNQRATRGRISNCSALCLNLLFRQ